MTTARLRWPQLFAYGLFGLPLAMVALPVYVYVPQFYAQRSGLALAAIGFALLLARLLSAFIDPALGWWMARQAASPGRFANYPRCIALSLPLLLGGFGALFHPPALTGPAAMAWFLASLMLVYGGYGLAMIAHQSWGAALTAAPDQRSRVMALREGCGLVGVIAAAALTGWLGYDGLSLLFAACLLLAAALLLRRAPRPPAAPIDREDGDAGKAGHLLAPFRDRRFRALFAVLIVNGVAAAIPATLFLFFADDRLGLARLAGPLLALYFAAAAASMPAWVALSRRYGEARAWGGGMLLSALVFVWAYALPFGAAAGFGAICLLSGLTLGADLALPAALLAGVIRQAGHGGRREAAYFGLWNWGVQINLALAAGIALPLLQWFGYVPGQRGGVTALAAAYALLPCALKMLAALMLWRAPLREI